MALIETEAIVLRTYDLGDADKIVVTLTQHHGLVRGVAKGAKRLKSKFGGTLEPFSIVLVTYLQKEERELVTIQHIELIRSFFKIASEPLFLQNSPIWSICWVILHHPTNQMKDSLRWQKYVWKRLRRVP